MIAHFTENPGRPWTAPATHRNEFPARYSLAGWSPPEPASASLAALILQSSKQPVQENLRTVTVQILGCLRNGRSPNNIKLASVASDALGVSGRTMLRALIAAEDRPEKLADMAHGKLRAKPPQVCLALEGAMQEHHRFLLGELLDNVGHVEKKLAGVDQDIARRMLPFEQAMARWKTIPRG